MKKTLHFLTLTALLLAASSCIKPGNSSIYMERSHFGARFENYFSPGETGMMLFLSDMSGNLLAEQSLAGQHGDFYFNIYPKNGGIFPNYIVETLVYKGPPSGGKSTVYLYTYLQILPANWTWTTFHADSTGHTTLNFSNIPAHSAYSIATSSQWTKGSNLPVSVPISLGTVPDNAYILLNTITNGHRYKWLTGLTPLSYPVSLNTTFTTLSKSLPVPPTASLSYRLNGYLTPGTHSSGAYTLDYADDTTNPGSITLHFPETLFSDFEFYINTFDPSDTRRQFYEYDFGTIPNRVDRLNANITVLNPAPNHFSVQTTGGFDRLGSTWKYDPIGPNRYQWTVYGSPTSTTFKFPTLPSDLAAQLTGLSIDSLKLSSVEIKDFSGITSYDDLIKSMFVSGKYIADIVPKYSGLIVYMEPSK
jgi:hypothetical protein